MILAAVLFLLAGDSRQGAGSILMEVRERTSRDTIRLDLVFAGTRPGAARIGIDGNPGRTGDFLLEFEGARGDREALRKLPSWLHDRTRKDTDKIRLTADLDERTPWRGRWEGDTLQLVLLDRVDRGSVLTNPWVLATAGVLVLGGTGVAWTGMGGSPASRPVASPPSADEIIPPPDIAFP